jgi:hypothetical protein
VGPRPLQNGSPGGSPPGAKHALEDSTGDEPYDARVSDPAAVLDAFVAALDGETRRLGPGEWGMTVDAAGSPLHVGVALREGLLRAQAQVAEPGALDPHTLLHWNRQVPLVRFSHTRAGEVWRQGELPPAAVTPRELDRFLGLLVRVATEAREAVHRG